jgi:hypothetical protein
LLPGRLRLGRSWFKAQPREIFEDETPISKKKQSDSRGRAPVCKHKALSSNPRPTETKTKAKNETKQNKSTCKYYMNQQFHT